MKTQLSKWNLRFQSNFSGAWGRCLSSACKTRGFFKKLSLFCMPLASYSLSYSRDKMTRQLICRYFGKPYNHSIFVFMRSWDLLCLRSPWIVESTGQSNHWVVIWFHRLLFQDVLSLNLPFILLSDVPITTKLFLLSWVFPRVKTLITLHTIAFKWILVSLKLRNLFLACAKISSDDFICKRTKYIDKGPIAAFVIIHSVKTA